MKIVKDYPRRLVGLFWATSTCLFLWFFSQLKTQPFSPASFFFFSFMLIGGGISYQILVELLTTPFHEDNTVLWKKLLVSMSFLMGVLFVTGGLIFIDVNIWPRNGLLVFISLVFGYGGLWIMSSKIICAFKAISAKPQL